MKKHHVVSILKDKNESCTNELLHKINHQKTLLTISKHICTIKNRKELFSLIISEVKNIIPVDNTAIVVLNEDGTMWQNWTNVDNHQDVTGIKKIYDSKQIELLGYHPICAIMKDCFKSIGIRTIEYYVDGNHPFADYMYEDGLKEIMHIPLIFHGKTIGSLFFESKEYGTYSETYFEDFKTIANLIAIAVANIITTEKNTQLCDLKTLELSLFRKMALTTNWIDKMLALNKLLQPYIPNSLLVINFENRNNKCPLYAYLRTGFNEYKSLFKEDMLRITKMDGERFLQIRSNLIQTYDNPFILKGELLIENNKNNMIKHQICTHFDFKSNFIYPLKLEKYGKIIFSFYGREENQFNESHINLFRDLDHNLSLVLNNFLAIEEIEILNKNLIQENTYLLEEVKNKSNFETIIGSSESLFEVFKNVNLVANTDTTVLILGETGTGKELIARALHNSSKRREKSFIRVNCATLNAQLIESELFGHEKGSFTGAFERKIGKFELADNGTIFLDEIGELPLELQAKLLRVIQEKEFDRVGGKSPIECDVRIIAATNRVLEKEVENGKFRSDLFFRLNVFPIKLPPLRERADDIPLLATYFGQKFSKKMNKQFKGISINMLESLSAYQWPGNIRELENVIEQAVIVNNGNKSLELARQLQFIKSSIVNIEKVKIINQKSYKEIKLEREKNERDIIIKVMHSTKGRVRGINGAAAILDIKPTTLESKMKKYKIFKDEFGILSEE